MITDAAPIVSARRQAYPDAYGLERYLQSGGSQALRGALSDPAAVGLYGQPTIVNNVETVSNIPFIVTHGGAAFAALGEGSSTGTRLFALSGRIRRPGTYEVEMAKTTFATVSLRPAALPVRTKGRGERRAR